MEDPFKEQDLGILDFMAATIFSIPHEKCYPSSYGELIAG